MNAKYQLGHQKQADTIGEALSWITCFSLWTKAVSATHRSLLHQVRANGSYLCWSESPLGTHRRDAIDGGLNTCLRFVYGVPRAGSVTTSAFEIVALLAVGGACCHNWRSGGRSRNLSLSR